MMPSLKTNAEIIRMSQQEDIPALKEMWKICFGDSDESIDSFFAHAYGENTTLVLFDEKKPAAMLTMLPSELSSPLKNFSGYYVYAVATLPEHRGKGYMSALEEACCQLAKQEGKDFCLLVPATPPLFQMYAKLGYSTFSSLSTIQLTSNPEQIVASLEPCDFSEFQCLRTKFLSQFQQAVRFEKDYERYAYEEYLRSGGFILKMVHDYVCGYHSTPSSLMITESSLSQAQLEKSLASLLECTKCKTAELRCAGKDDFSMIKWLETENSSFILSQTPAKNYFGFALD